jgi:hypothetical protein
MRMRRDLQGTGNVELIQQTLSTDGLMNQQILAVPFLQVWRISNMLLGFIIIIIRTRAAGNVWFGPGMTPWEIFSILPPGIIARAPVQPVLAH